MQIHDNLIQGSAEWLAYRATHFNASDAPAMMGVSPYKTRNQLIHEIHTGLAADVDAGTQARFDDGHRFEALARPRAEQIVGEDLYPVVASLGKLSASFDGLTLGEETVFEHKTLNDEIRAAATADDLAPHYRIQMEQQLLVSGAGRCLFLASKWNEDDLLIEDRYFWYMADLELREKIVAGWDQFEADLLVYQPGAAAAPKPAANVIMEFPSLQVTTRGEVVSSNLPQYKEHADRFIAAIKTTLETDQDFVDAEETVKFCKRAEETLESVKANAIAQTASIDEVMRTIDHIQSQFRSKRLTLDKLVVSEKQLRKEKILATGKSNYEAHMESLEAEVDPLRLVMAAPDFAGAMKGKRTLESLKNAVDTALANFKIAANEAAADLRAKKNWYAGAAVEHTFLFNDLVTLGSKPIDDFKLVVETRIAAHKTEQQAKADKLAEESREKIRAEEQEKATALAKEQAAPQQATSEPAAAEVIERTPIGQILHDGLQRYKAAQAAPAPVAAVEYAAEHEFLEVAYSPPDPVIATTPPTLRLGQIGERLGFTVTADFLTSLGFAPAATDKAAKLYHDADFKNICAALIRHISSVAAK